VVGIDASKCHASGHVEQEEMILRHIGELRKRFRNQPIIIVPENQTGYFETRVSELVVNLPNVRVLHQDGKEKPGVTKTARITSGYTQCLEDAFNQNAVAFDRRWFTTTIIKKDSPKSQTFLIKNLLKDELLRFCYDEKGKLTGKVNGYTDDKAVAFLMFYYWGRAILNSDIGNPYLPLLPKDAIIKFMTKQSVRQNMSKRSLMGSNLS
jgi:hypothetical protein